MAKETEEVIDRSVTPTSDEGGSVVMTPKYEKAELPPRENGNLTVEGDTVSVSANISEEEARPGDPTKGVAGGDESAVYISVPEDKVEEEIQEQPKEVKEETDTTSDVLEKLKELRTTARRMPYLLKHQEEFSKKELADIAATYDGDVKAFAEAKLK